MEEASHTLFSIDLRRVFTQRQRRVIGALLRGIATWFYLVAIAALLATWMEVWKGVELLAKIHNAWFSFSSARETTAYAVIILVAGRLIDVLSKKFEPRYKHRPERGWHYRDR
jgi:hypothetical protein